MAKLIAFILIVIHIHHSLVMIAGDVMQVKVVAAAMKAGIPLFDHNGGDTDQGNDATESLEVEDADICSRNFLAIDPGFVAFPHSFDHADKPRRNIVPAHVEILTPPPQA